MCHLLFGPELQVRKYIFTFQPANVVQCVNKITTTKMDPKSAQAILNFYHNVSDLIGMPSGLKTTLAQTLLNPDWDLTLVKSMLEQSSEG